MARKPDTQNPFGAQAKDFPEATAAFEAHAALVRAENANPQLAENPYWRALRDTAFARFYTRVVGR